MKKLKIKERLRKISRDLKIRWVVVSCLIILPVNILTTVITLISSNSYEEKITQANASQLNIYAERIEAEFNYISSRVMDFLNINNLATLTGGSTTDSVVEVIRFKEKINNSKIWNTFPGICYFWDHERDIISFFHQKKSYNMAAMQSIEDYLRKEEKGGGIYAVGETLLLDQSTFIVKHYNFQYFSFGLLLDVEWILQNFYNNCSEIKGTIYLADKSGGLISGFLADGFVADVTDRTVEQLHDKDTVVVERPIYSGEYRIVQVVARADIMENLPMLINVLYVLTAISFIALPILCIFAVRQVIRPLFKLCDAMAELEQGNLEYHLPIQTGTIQMDYLYLRFNHMVDELHSLVIASYEQEIDRLQTDAINMRLQVNQHMLLNFLNTIYSLSQVQKVDQISEFSLLLMKYFRYVLRQNIALVPIKEEIEFVKDYLDIQRIRFPESFTSVYAVDESADSILIPQLLIQNFVENTIKYGLIMGSEIEILINIRVEDARLLISICDTGNGMSETMVQQLQNGEIIENRTGKHIGIWNCRRRLRYYYGDTFEMKITSKLNEGTQIWIELPLMPLNNDEAAQMIHRMERKQG